MAAVENAGVCCGELVRGIKGRGKRSAFYEVNYGFEGDGLSLGGHCEREGSYGTVRKEITRVQAWKRCIGYISRLSFFLSELLTSYRFMCCMRGVSYPLGLGTGKGSQRDGWS